MLDGFENSLDESLKELNKLGRASGLKVNIDTIPEINYNEKVKDIRHLFQFIWQLPTDRIKREVLCQDYFNAS